MFLRTRHLEQYRCRKDRRNRQVIGLIIPGIRNCCRAPLHWLRFNANTIEHLSGPNSTVDLFANLYGLVGVDICFYRSGPGSFRALCCSILPWYHRGCILS